MLYSASSRLRSASRICRSFWMSVCSAMSRRTSGDQEPHERQPQLAGVGQRPIVDEHVARIEVADDLEQGPKAKGILRIETRAMTYARARANLAVLGRLPGEVERVRVVRPVEARELERHGKRPARRAEQRLRQRRVEIGELFVGWLFRQIEIRPESLERAVVGHVHGRGR